MVCLAAAAAAQPTDYAAELASLDRRLEENGGLAVALAPPAAELERTTRLAHLVYRRASLTANYGDFRLAEQAIATAIAAVGPSEDLLFLDASFAFKMHRLARTRELLALIPARGRAPRWIALAADLAYQEGDYGAARRGYQAALAKKRGWDDLARLAYLESRTGRRKEADKLYAEAQDDLTVKEMRSWAWLELQRGLLDLEFGDPAAALEHYRRAERGYSGWWLIEEHAAEALARLGRREEAAALYRRVLKAKRGPEFLAALAALEPPDAAALAAEAEKRFAEESALYPEAALGHHLEHLLERPRGSPEDGDALLALARRNAELRPGGEARLLLARAHAKNGNREAARAELAAIAATSWRGPGYAELRRRLR